ncbi:MAG: hypothetical protein DHS20C17_28840 [Cyclobacteriaceae bacterium]|nr:MAG: hypothetical protein DHS20C17_28840 [Cyclobacteriaceae bacterium]
MKKFIYFFYATVVVLFFANSAFSQDDKSKRPSPPKTASGQVGDLKIVIKYGAPSVKGRTIFGSGSESLEKYGEVWRTGANEATTFSISKDAMINGKSLSAGKYGLFTIPGENEWVVIFNKNADQWGAYDYDESDDALRIQVAPKNPASLQEQLLFKVTDEGQVSFAWENVAFEFMVSAK